MDIQKFIEEVKAMTVVEINEFVKALEEELGVSAAAPVAVAGAAGAAEAAEAAPAEEEKTEFNIVLKDFGANKIAVIKAVVSSRASALQRQRRQSSPSACSRKLFRRQTQRPLSQSSRKQALPPFSSKLHLKSSRRGVSFFSCFFAQKRPVLTAIARKTHNFHSEIVQTT